MADEIVSFSSKQYSPRTGRFEVIPKIELCREKLYGRAHRSDLCSDWISHPITHKGSWRVSHLHWLSRLASIGYHYYMPLSV